MATIFKRPNRDHWLIQWFNHEGRRREKSSGTTDRKVAERIAAKLEADDALRREGVIDPRDDRFAAAQRRPLGEHLDEFKADLKARGNTGIHVDQTVRLAREILSLAKAEYISDLTPTSVQQALAKFRSEGPGRDEGVGRSLTTCNHALRAVKSFSRWLHRDRRAREDALFTLKAFNADGDVRHGRRNLTDAELAKLIKTTEGRDLENGMTGPDRAMLYLLAASTGFRRKELKSLVPESFELGENSASIRVAAAHTKAGREDVIPISREVAERIKPWLCTKSSGQPVFGSMPKNTARTLRWDLKAAGIPYRVGGQVFDFHAFRGLYISRLERTGASIKVLQTLARHKDPRLTLKRYARVRREDEVRSVEAMPSIFFRAGRSLKDAVDHQQKRQHSGHKMVRLRATACTLDDKKTGRTGRFNSWISPGVSDSVRAGASTYPLGDLNPCSRTENPMS